MAQHHVHILSELHIIDIRMDRIIGKFQESPSGISSERDYFVAFALGILNSFDNILRIPGTGDREDNIPFFQFLFQLHGEDIFITAVVGDGHDGSDVVVETDEPEFLLQMDRYPLVEIAYIVGCCRSTPAVPEDIHRTFLLVCVHKHVHDGIDLLPIKRIEHSLESSEVSVDVIDVIVIGHGYRIVSVGYIIDYIRNCVR